MSDKAPGLKADPRHSVLANASHKVVSPQPFEVSTFQLSGSIAKTWRAVLATPWLLRYFVLLACSRAETQQIPTLSVHQQT